MNNSEKSRKNIDKKLPWWVELFFVQIGLPDKLLIKLLKAKKKSKEIIKNDDKFIISSLFLVAILFYLYPVVKNAKNLLDCEATARSYIINNKNLTQINKKELKMMSSNLCYGGKQFNELENLKTKI